MSTVNYNKMIAGKRDTISPPCFCPNVESLDKVERSRFVNVSASISSIVGNKRKSIQKEVLEKDKIILNCLKLISKDEVNDFATIAQILLNNNIQLFDKRFFCCESIIIKDVRIIVWQMESNKRDLLKGICKMVAVKEKQKIQEDKQLLIKCCFGEKCNRIDCHFINELLLNQEDVFNNKSDPLYDSNGVIDEISKIKLLENLVDPLSPQEFVKDSIFSLYLFSSLEEVSHFIAGAHAEMIFARSENNEIYFDLIQQRIMCLCQVTFTLYPPTIEIINSLKFLLDPIYPKDFYEFILEIYNGKHFEHYQCRKPSPTTKSKEKLKFDPSKPEKVMNSLKIKRKRKKSIEVLCSIPVLDSCVLTSLEPFFVAENIAQFDFKEYDLVEVKEIIFYEHELSFRKYQKKMKCFVNGIKGIIEKETDVTFFISVAYYLFLYNQFNASYLVYSALTQKHYKNKQLFDNLNKSTLVLYDKLNLIFKESNEDIRFWEYYNSLKESIPKLFVVEFWVKKMKSDDVLTLVLDDKLNAEKIRKMSENVQLWVSPKQTKFGFEEVESVMEFLNNITELEL